MTLAERERLSTAPDAESIHQIAMFVALRRSHGLEAGWKPVPQVTL
ncbi:MAG TPA: hypothetical protein VK797_09830 [Tepidisphaeraceae bacterium]|jgi:hypothetical protein|nr:hypothetical protein [Tepidisphaeraceae bacterium]